MQSSASRRCNVGFFQPSEDRALDDGMTFLAAIVDQFVECFRHRFHEPYLAFDLQLFFAGKSATVPTPDRKTVVWGQGVSVGLDLGGVRFLKKKNKKNKIIEKKNR